MKDQLFKQLIQAKMMSNLTNDNNIIIPDKTCICNNNIGTHKDINSFFVCKIDIIKKITILDNESNFNRYLVDVCKNNWCLWGELSKPQNIVSFIETGKIDKTPINPNTLNNAKSNDFNTWSSFEKAIELYKLKNYGGLSLQLTACYSFLKPPKYL